MPAAERKPFHGGRFFGSCLRRGHPAVLHRAPGGEGEALHGAEHPALQAGVALVQVPDELLDLLALGIPVGGGRG